jgi:hypothetical protein
MKNRTLAFALAIVIVIGMAVRRAGGQSASGGWELATIVEVGAWMENGLQVGVAKICYQGAEGCRWEEVRVEMKPPPI